MIERSIEHIITKKLKDNKAVIVHEASRQKHFAAIHSKKI